MHRGGAFAPPLCVFCLMGIERNYSNGNGKKLARIRIMAGAVGLSPRRLRRQHGQQHVPGFRVILHTLFIFSGVQASMARNVVVASICVIRVILHTLFIFSGVQASMARNVVVLMKSGKYGCCYENNCELIWRDGE